jgi:hypothetical protein|nr:hypothetical protein [Mariniblastus sp.]
MPSRSGKRTVEPRQHAGGKFRINKLLKKHQSADTRNPFHSHRAIDYNPILGGNGARPCPLTTTFFISRERSPPEFGELKNWFYPANFREPTSPVLAYIPETATTGKSAKLE